MSETVHWRIDGIEEGVARIEVLGDGGGELLHLPLTLLPPDVREDEILAVTIERDPDGRVVRLTIAPDRAATERALAKSIEQVKGLKPGGSGDIQL